MTFSLTMAVARRMFVTGCAALLVASPRAAMSQEAENFPTEPVEFIVPFAAGGGNDLHARVLADQLSEQIGQSVVVINRPGASGAIGSEAVINADADGHTMLLQSVSSAVTLGETNDNLNYSPTEDLIPVSLIARFPLVMIVNKDIQADTLEEFVQLLKENPGQYSYGHSGFGSTLELVGEYFKAEAGVDITGIPYKGTGEITPDLLGGRLAMMLNGLPPEFERIQNGEVKAIAVTSAERSAVAPDIPALRETYPDFNMPFWLGVYMKAGTNPEVVQKMSDEIAKAMRDDEVVERLEAIGSEPVGSTPEAFDVFWKDQIKIYRNIVENMDGNG